MLFFADGAIFGSWVSRVPAIEDHIHARTGPLGLALLGIAFGTLLSRQMAGQLVVRMGSRVIARAGIVSCCATLPLPALAPTALWLLLALSGFGAALGVLDVAINANGVAVQAQVGRPIMSSFHGIYSIGGLSGSLAGGRAAAAGAPVFLHFLLAGVVLAGLSLLVSPWLLGRRGLRSRGAGAGTAGREEPARGWAKLPSPYRLPLFMLGLVALCSMVGEGAAGDWGAIYLRHNLGTSIGFASSGFAAYSLAMAAGRLLGDRLVARWGELYMITRSAAVAGTGFAIAVLIGDPVAAICGFTVLGLGLAAVIPVTFSAAGRLGGNVAGPAITVVSSIAVVGSLAGPPVIGFAAEVVGLPAALGLVSLLAFAAAGLIWTVKPVREHAPARKHPAASLT
ncbi:MAG TPA: MFS transporter [Streptosporangiaceae bacterium]|nr:MFS transporter [Streptosporangiaceae bacterium]